MYLVICIHMCMCICICRMQETRVSGANKYVCMSTLNFTTAYCCGCCCCCCSQRCKAKMATVAIYYIHVQRSKCTAACTTVKRVRTSNKRLSCWFKQQKQKQTDPPPPHEPPLVKTHCCVSINGLSAFLQGSMIVLSYQNKNHQEQQGISHISRTHQKLSRNYKVGLSRK